MGWVLCWWCPNIKSRNQNLPILFFKIIVVYLDTHLVLNIFSSEVFWVYGMGSLLVVPKYQVQKFANFANNICQNDCGLSRQTVSSQHVLLRSALVED